MQRVLLVKRYSGDDDAGALERQQAALEAWVAENDVIPAQGPDDGWVEDETVSGSVNLDERKSLGQWMREPLLDNWDRMVVTEQDRVTRDDIHWWAFVGKLLNWGKHLTVLDDPQLDLSTPNGRMIAGIKATQATNYRLDVQKKQKNARAKYREQRRFLGGHWPYGYRAVPRDGGGWGLQPDPETSEYVREMVRRMIQGDSMRSIALDFNRRGIPTGRDHQTLTYKLKPGEERPEPQGYQWHEATVKKILRHPAMLGYAMHKGEIIREEGLPVQWTDPIVKPDEFRKVQEIMDERGSKRIGQRTNRSPMLGVVFCWCERPMHYVVNKGYRYYRCSSVNKGERCEYASSWPFDMVLSTVEGVFLEGLGDKEVRTKRYQPGINHNEEIESLRDAVEHLSGNLSALKPGSRAAQSTIEKLSEYEAKLDELEAEPITPATWEYHGTGKTFREIWESAGDWSKKGSWLLRSGIAVYFGGTPQVPRIHFQAPEDLTAQLFDAMTS